MKLKRFFRHNGLSFALLVLFLVTFGGGQAISGWRSHNEDRANYGEPALPLGRYLVSAHFLEATAENWESEFLEMYVFIVITVFLFQKGSAESKDPDRPVSRRAVTANSPWLVRRGGWGRRIYSHSLSTAFATLFVVAFILHACASTRLENEERARFGKAPETVVQHLGGPKFWFQSFQNWQSEFLAIGCMVVFTIYLREKNSPESKALEAPHDETGE